MFTYPTFHADIIRHVVVAPMRWPAKSERGEDAALGGNRQFADLTGLAWSEAADIFEVETALIARIERAPDAEQEYELIEDELYDGDDLCGLDIGVASAVAALSAARCIPFTSCNASSFGGNHAETYPLVGFFARSQQLELLLAAATEAQVGLENSDGGCLVVYANDVRKLRLFAAALIRERNAFDSLHLAGRNRTPGA